jgi:succinate dehydrogenase / fumarate reductase cytochrome b subunit
MSQTIRQPRYYRRGSWQRLVEGLRYGGGVGQWSWLLHRVTGLGILLFLIVHVVDTFFVVAYPELYDHTVAIYGGTLAGLPVGWGINGYYWPLRWAFRLGELGLIACVLFHSVNGVRVILFDFWPGAAKHQQKLFTVVMVVFWAIMIPVSVWVLMPLAGPPVGR